MNRFIRNGFISGFTDESRDEKILLDVRHLKKAYRQTPVLNDVSFYLKRGHILGLIGKNGAGKTTLMKSILGLNRGFQGEIYFQGEILSPEEEGTKAEIGSLVDVSFYEDLTAYENLEAAMMLSGKFSAAQRKKRIYERLRFVGLADACHQRVRSFSFGMKQRLGLAQAILAEPLLLVLDEPFVGLDPIGIEEAKELLRRLCRENRTSIIFSSHQLTEVCGLADDIMVLKDGAIQYYDTYEHTKQTHASLVDLMR